MAESKDIISGILDVQDKIISKLRYNDRAMVTLSGAVNAALRVNKINNKVILLGPCTNLGLSIEESAITLNWTDPNDVELNETLLSEWEETILVKKEDSYPVNYADGEIIARTSKNLINKNYYRDHSFVDTNINQNKTYYYMLFSRTSEGAWNNLIVNKFTSGTGLNWQQVGEFVEAGRGPELFPVGTTFIVEHPEYNTSSGISGAIAFRVVGHDQVPATDETLHHTMCLDMCEILFSTIYDAKELEYALTEDMVTKVGKAYYIYDGSTYTQLIEGTDYQIGDIIPVATYYEKNGLNNDKNGKWKFSESNILQWANSDGNADSWFVKQNIWDKCNSAYLSKNGFLKYLDKNFLAIIKNPKLITANDENKDNIKFWLLSKSQIFGSTTYNIMENERLSYYANGNSIIKQNSGTNDAWWLRTAGSGGWVATYISSSGSFVNGSCDGGSYCGVSLACIVGKPNRMQYWKEVQEIVRKGRGPQVFPVGTIFVVDHPEYTHQDGRGLIFRVVGHDQVPTADETIQHTMCLDMVDSLFTAQYDAPELEYALTEDIVTKIGKIYYTYNGSTYSQLIEGTDYNIGDNIPVATYYEKNLTNRSLYSNNNFRESNLLQWANSNGNARTWFIKQNIWDKVSDIFDNKNGFLKYIDQEFLSVVQSAKLITAKCNEEGGGSSITNAKFWPLSNTQVFGIMTNNNISENTQLSWFSNNDKRKKSLLENGEFYSWILRSPYVSSSYGIDCVTTGGERYYNASAYAFRGVSLACIIG